jgi:hypothetical protein
MKSYSRPILAAIFDILGYLSFGAGVVLIIFGFYQARDLPSPEASSVRLMAIGSALGCCAVGAIYVGFGQLVEYLARTAFNTGLLVDLATKSAQTAASTAAAVQTLAAKTPNRESPSQYYYSINGDQKGPFDAEDIRGFVFAGAIEASTPVFRAGDTEWRTAQLYPELRS